MAPAHQPVITVANNIPSVVTPGRNRQAIVASTSSKPSSKGTFISFTAQVTMRNREQVEAIYKALNDSPHVKITL